MPLLRRLAYTSLSFRRTASASSPGGRAAAVRLGTRRASLLAALTLLLGLASCNQPTEQMQPFKPKEKDYGRALPPGALALRKIDPRDYPDFAPGFERRAELEQAIRHSLDYLSRPSSRRYFPYGDVTHERAVASLNAFLSVLHSARDAREFDQLIRARFEVYQSVGCDDRGTVYFTGYYTPIFEGRKHADERFRYPIYKIPADLVKDDEGRTIGRRAGGASVIPGYYTRREIEQSGLMRGRELAWLQDPFEVYVVTVQGSAKLRLENGGLWELGYAANNGHEYTPIAPLLVRDRAIKATEVSLQAMRRFFTARPDLVPHYTWNNDRFVFFKETSGGPYGSINVPVTPFYSIATDKEVFPRACLAFMQTRIPAPAPAASDAVAMRPYAGFALDHDTGGAIRAAGRCDIYMGVGPQAEALAGRTGAEGRLYYIFVRPTDLASGS
jgi:membrane-bound lytic murein transglycosylase A